MSVTKFSFTEMEFYQEKVIDFNWSIFDKHTFKYLSLSNLRHYWKLWFYTCKCITVIFFQGAYGTLKSHTENSYSKSLSRNWWFNIRNNDYKIVIHGQERWAQWLRALDALPESKKILIPRTHMVSHNCLWHQFLGIQCPLLTS